MENKIKDAIREQVKTIAENYKNNKPEFGFISANLILKDCGLGVLDRYDYPMVKLCKIVCKEFGLKYDVKKGRVIA